MNAVYLNIFERSDGLDGTIRARLSINEQSGEWRIGWLELASGQDEAGDEHDCESDYTEQEEIWYSGDDWGEMLHELRARLAIKRQEGFNPIIELPAGRAAGYADRSAFTRKLEYYSELHADMELYEALRKWRNGLAAQEKKSPFILASNRMLKMISAFVPQNEQELLQIPGFGEQKASLYGAYILALTRNAARPTSFPLTWVEQAVQAVDAERWVLERQEQRRKSEAARQELKSSLLQAVAGGLTLSAIGPALSLSRRELFTWLEELDKEGYELEPLIEAELADIPGVLIDKAWREFAASGDRYLRPILQRLHNEKSLNDEALSRTYEWLRLLRIRFRRARSEGDKPDAPDETEGQQDAEQNAESVG
jgi:hypothetical protein